MFGRLAWFLCMTLLPFGGCLAEERSDAGPTGPATSGPAPPTGPFGAASSAFQPMGRIPRQYTCDGPNKNPAFTFSNLPVNATNVALIMEDPDVPSRTAPQRVVEHWVFWNLPRANTTIAAEADPAALGAKVGRAYRGPCPPDGSGEHRYFFYSFAQTKALDLADGSNATALRQALKGSVGATHQFHGIYSKPCISPICN
ncbi:MAG: YbhB/YbcL family Raf kinase inhibitor-like protein [Euryarchaeota archaeon]|nr:YbhB/YbcL family Raf kinase inhibitor-like protein [Euryarchaeota archaeon]